MRKFKDQGQRKHKRITLDRQAFAVLEPGGPWLECTILDISEGGARLDIGALPVPKLFVLILTPKGEVRRACVTAWRNGPILGARFVGIKQLRQGLRPKSMPIRGSRSCRSTAIKSDRCYMANATLNPPSAAASS